MEFPSEAYPLSQKGTASWKGFSDVLRMEALIEKNIASKGDISEREQLDYLSSGNSLHLRDTYHMLDIICYVGYPL